MTPKFPSGNEMLIPSSRKEGRKGDRLEGLAWLLPRGQVRSPGRRTQVASSLSCKSESSCILTPACSD